MHLSYGAFRNTAVQSKEYINFQISSNIQSFFYDLMIGQEEVDNTMQAGVK